LRNQEKQRLKALWLNHVYLQLVGKSPQEIQDIFSETHVLELVAASSYKSLHAYTSPRIPLTLEEAMAKTQSLSDAYVDFMKNAVAEPQVNEEKQRARPVDS
jgi:hypothetical protein